LSADHADDESLEEVARRITEEAFLAPEEQKALLHRFVLLLTINRHFEGPAPYGVPLGDPRNNQTIWTAPFMCSPSEVREFKERERRRKRRPARVVLANPEAHEPKPPVKLQVILKEPSPR
jgi:hypothetical protein